MNGMRQVFPDRPVEDLQDKDEIFHVLYDMDDRFQVPGEQYIRSGRTYEKDGYAASGAASATTTAASSSPSATTCTWATRGSGQTTRSIPSSFRRWRFG